MVQHERIFYLLVFNGFADNFSGFANACADHSAFDDRTNPHDLDNKQFAIQIPIVYTLEALTDFERKTMKDGELRI